MRGWDKENSFGIAGLLLLILGCWLGLLHTPPEQYMSDVQRIFFVHVATAWDAMLVLTGAFVVAIFVLVHRKPSWDAALHGLVEVGVVYTVMLLVQGSIWGKATWGAYWTWDPRLTTSAILAVAFAGVLSLRSFAEDPSRRASWTAVATIVAWLDIPIVYYSVKWWPGLHQAQSRASGVSPEYKLPLYLNALALLFIAGWLVARRARISMLQDAAAARQQSAPETRGAGRLVAGD
jgi:heme exporter protein C